MKTHTHETHVSPQRPNETDEGYSRRIADTLHDAAPDLLQVAKDFLLLAQLHDWEGAAIDFAKTTLAKAEGRA